MASIALVVAVVVAGSSVMGSVGSVFFVIVAVCAGCLDGMPARERSVY